MKLVVTRRHLLGGARGEAEAMDKRMDAADSMDVVAVAVAVAVASTGKVNDFCLRCGGGVPNSGMSRGLALDALVAWHSVGGI